jgi:hypothetical protein
MIFKGAGRGCVNLIHSVQDTTSGERVQDTVMNLKFSQKCKGFWAAEEQLLEKRPVTGNYLIKTQ